MASAPPTPPGKSVTSTIVGWLIVAVIAWLVLSSVIGTIRWLLRGVVLIALLVGLLWLWAYVKTPKDPPSAR